MNEAARSLSCPPSSSLLTMDEDLYFANVSEESSVDYSEKISVDTTSNSSTFPATDDKKTNEHDDFGQIPSAQVLKRWRLVVALFLAIMGALVVTSTFLFLSWQETDAFEKSVSGRASSCDGLLLSKS